MTLTLIIIAIGAFALGALILFLTMRTRFASLIANDNHHKEETEELQQQIDTKSQEIAQLLEEQKKLSIEKGSLQKEIDIQKEILKEKELEIENNTNRLKEPQEKLNHQIQNNGIVKAELESTKKETELTRNYINEKEKTIQSQKTDINTIQEKLRQQTQKTSQVQVDLESIKKELELTKKKIEEKDIVLLKKDTEILDLNDKLEQLKNDISNVISQRNTAQKEIAIIKEQIQKNEQEREKTLDQQLQMAKEQLQNATQEILKQREESLNKANNEQMGNVVTPLKEQLEAIQKQVTENIKTTTDNKASIEKAIDELMKRTLEIGNDANNLARALKNESKTQGNWGELILEKLLESSGLEEGVHYDRQTTIRDNTGKPVFHDETGKRLIPDIIIHYPDGKDCIIDSKVSLSDYLDYCNAETDDVREQALKRHIVSIRKHVKELAGKDYSSYIQPPHQRLNYTIMFVPNEFATQLALQNDRMLWRESFDKGIFITSEQNLLALLRMIQIAWTQVQQARNQQEVIDQARKLLDRVSDFAARFDKVGEQIQKASESFSNAKDKLYNGQQSIVKAARDMEKLGYKPSPKRQLPEPSDWKV